MSVNKWVTCNAACCSDDGSAVAAFQVVPAVVEDESSYIDTTVTWEVFAPVFLLWPFVFQLCIATPVLILLNKMYHWYEDHHWVKAKIVYILHHFLGTHDMPKVVYPRFLICFYICELCFSLLSVWIWEHRTRPPHDDPAFVMYMEWILCLFFTFHYFIKRCQQEFSPSQCWGSGDLINILTVVPFFFCYDLDFNRVKFPWLSLNFLRCFCALQSYEHIETLGAIEIFPEFARAVFRMILRLLSLVVLMGGTVFTLEVLGDVEALIDEPVSTRMGDLSLIQMCYWIMTTISTVGYGDFSPTTVLSRVAVSIFILVGVAFFSVESAKLVELSNLLDQGKGKYRSGASHNHVVVCGTSVGAFDTLISRFLEEIFHPDHGADNWPDVVFLSETPFEAELKHFVHHDLPRKAKHKVIFLVGSVLNDNDLSRVQLEHCQFGLVLPDTEAVNLDVEDQKCIMRVLAMKTFCPQVRVRVMLNRPDSKMQCLNVGIRSQRCFAANELKASILVQSCRIRGFIPFITNLLRSGNFHEGADSTDALKEYCHGVDHAVYGVCISDEYDNVPFGEFTAVVYQRYAFLAIAVQIDGKIVLAPFDHILRGEDIVFALATGLDQMMLISQKGVDWKKKFITNRNSVVGPEGAPPKTPPKPTVIPEMAKPAEVSSRGGLTTAFDLHMLEASDSKQPEDQGQCPPVDGEAKVPGPKKQSRRPRAINENQAIDDETREAQLILAEEFRQCKGCITVIVAKPNPVWQQVVTCLSTLRQKYLPFHQPIIVLTSQPPPRYIVYLFEAVAFLAGIPHRIDNLISAGVLDSCAVVLLEGENHKEFDMNKLGQDQQGLGTQCAQKIQDSSTLILCSIIEHLLQNSDIDHKPFVIYEFLSDELVRWLPSVEEQGLGRTDTTHKTANEDDEEGLVKKVAHAAQNVEHQLASLAQKPAGSTGQEPLKLHPRYLAGQIFSPDFFGTLLGKMYYLPATIELMEAIVMPARRNQRSFFWQTVLPKDFSFRPYGELVQKYCRRSGKPKAIPVALYRRRDHNDARCYVVANPRPETLLRESDKVIWLGGKDFGAVAHEKGILEGSQYFPPQSPVAADVNTVDTRCSSKSEREHANGELAEKSTIDDNGSLTDLHCEVLHLNRCLHQLEARVVEGKDQIFQISQQVEMLPAKLVSLHEAMIEINRSNRRTPVCLTDL